MNLIVFAIPIFFNHHLAGSMAGAPPRASGVFHT